jgi:hypothetical protein
VIQWGKADQRGGSMRSELGPPRHIWGMHMILDLTSIIPLVTIIGAAAAPTIAAVWAEHTRRRDAKMADMKLDTIHTLVISQLSQAVDRLTNATKEIEELKRLVRELQNVGSSRPGHKWARYFFRNVLVYGS